MATSFGRRMGRFGARAAQGALVAAPTANPYAIGASALLSGVPALFEEDREFDPSPFRKGFRRYAANRRRQARRTADEAGAQAGAMLASRGLSHSPLGAGIAAGQRRMALQTAETEIANREANLEDQLAAAQEEVRIANQQDMRGDIQGVAKAGLALAGHVATTDSPLRKALGLPDVFKPPPPVIIHTEGKDYESPPEDKPPETGGSDTPEATKPGTPAPTTETVTTKKGSQVKSDSVIGQWHHRDPEIVEELEDLFGIDILDGIGLI